MSALFFLAAAFVNCQFCTLVGLIGLVVSTTVAKLPGAAQHGAAQHGPPRAEECHVGALQQRCTVPPLGDPTS